MTTTYSIFAGDATEAVATRSNKGKALELATALRNDDKVAVRVETGSGKVVLDLQAPKKIKMSRPYTRVVPVPAEVVEMIDNKRVAYKRGPKARQFALLDASRGEYAIWDIARGEQVDVEVATTREAGRWFADERRAYADATPVD